LTDIRRPFHLLLPMAALLIGLPAPSAMAQTIEIQPANTQLWLQYERRQGLSPDWSFFVNGGYRELWDAPLTNEEWSRWHLRSAFSYQQNSRLNFDLGSGLFYTDSPLTSDRTEFRTWLGATVYWPDSPGYYRRFVLTHRFRLEQRFFSDSGSSSWSFASRARYRLSTTIALNRKEVEPGAFYTYLSAEFFATFDQEQEKLFTDRNRFSAGLGYVTPSKWTLELRFTRQEIKDTVTGDYQFTDKIVEFRVKTYARSRDLMKKH
jgi:hypothetical protein